MYKNLRIEFELAYMPEDEAEVYNHVRDFIAEINDTVDHEKIFNNKINARNVIDIYDYFRKFFVEIVRNLAEDIEYVDHDNEHFEGSTYTFANILARSIYADCESDYSINFLADYCETE